MTTERRTRGADGTRGGAEGPPGVRTAGPATALVRAGRRLRSRAGAPPAWSPLVAGVLVGALAGGGYGLLRTPRYEATSYVVAVPAEGGDPASALGFAQAYGRVATQLAVLGDAQVWAGVPVSTLRGSVRTATSPDAPMVAVTATSVRPDLAADMANAVSRALTRHAGATAESTRVGLRQFARATEPAEPSSPSAALSGLVGASAGGLLGALGLLVRPRRTADDPGRPAAVPGPSPAPAPPAPATAATAAPGADVRGQR